MHELNTQEIEQISLGIEQQGLTYTPLQNELLDHVCCQIEIMMEQGLTFNEAYRKVKIEMGKKRIRQIQHETLSLISKKYRRMKRTMYAFGVTAPILMLAGITFKIFHWPGAGLILTLALLITGLIFLPLFAMVRIRDTRQQDEQVPMGLYLSGLIASMLSIMGALFKIQHFPGAGVMLTLGLASLAFVFLPMFVFAKMKEAESKNESFNSRLVIGGAIAGALVIIGALFKILHWPGAGIIIIVSWSLMAAILIPILVLNQLQQKDNKINNYTIIVFIAVVVSILILARVRSEPWHLLQGYHTPGQNFISNTELLEVQCDRILKDDEQMRMVAAEADELCSYMQEIKLEMVRNYSNKDNKPIDENGNINLESIYYQSSPLAAMEIIVERDEYKLYHMLNEYSKLALELSNDETLATYINTATENHSPYKQDEKLSPEEIWAEYCIAIAFPRALNTLSMYQSTVRMIEYQLLTELQLRLVE